MEQKLLLRIAAENKRQNSLEKKRIDARIKKFRDYIPIIIEEFLKIDPDIKKVVLFGSLVEKTMYHENFDMDIAVDSDRYLKIVSWCLDQPFKIDCLDLETAPTHITERIHKYGEILYETKK